MHKNSRFEMSKFTKPSHPFERHTIVIWTSSLHKHILDDGPFRRSKIMIVGNKREAVNGISNR